MAARTGVEPTFEVSQICAILAQTYGNQRVNGTWGESALGIIRAELQFECLRFCPNKRGPPAYRVFPVIVKSTGMLALETVLGLNFHVRTVLRTDLSSSGLPVLCAIEALVTLPLAGSTETTQTPLPAMRCERASCGYSGRGA